MISGTFGAGGKFKVKFSPPVPASSVPPGAYLTLPFKRFSHDKAKLMRQTGSDLEETLVPLNQVSLQMERVIIDKKAPMGAEDLEAALAQSEKEEKKRGKGKGKKEDKKEKDGTSAGAAKEGTGDIAREGKAAPPSPPTEISRMGVIDSLKEPLQGAEGGKEGDKFAISIVSGAFKIQENIRACIGSVVLGPNGEEGQLVGPFAKLGKCKVRFPTGIRGPPGGWVEIRVIEERLREVT